MASCSSASAPSIIKDDVTALKSEEGQPSARPETKSAEQEKEKEELNDKQERCGIWSLGPAFEDDAKVRAALDSLGPFLLESYACPLELIDPRRGLFDSDDGDVDERRVKEKADKVESTQLSGLQELQLNDVVDDDDERSTSSDSQSIEEVSDRLFESRVADRDIEAVGVHRSKRKRKAFETGSRNNFVKHNLRRKKKRFPRKQTKRPKKLNEKDPDHTYKALQEGVCLSKA